MSRTVSLPPFMGILKNLVWMVLKPGRPPWLFWVGGEGAGPALGAAAPGSELRDVSLQQLHLPHTVCVGALKEPVTP